MFCISSVQFSEFCVYVCLWGGGFAEFHAGGFQLLQPKYEWWNPSKPCSLSVASILLVSGWDSLVGSWSETILAEMGKACRHVCEKGALVMATASFLLDKNEICDTNRIKAGKKVIGGEALHSV